ncbi:polysaccharide deacetylase family protein [Prosthecobacter sp.]|uniref:polysaccharide deacetylase family protein n=1 Tax=Prosthecobacter sp. TaxID=1965333 RepID=UPI0024894D3C|nr:polysaccharide deacetylase family protein [Prosthecobacter sp.]MDI1310855.1 polysaccharide deacetylase family protein [Prosthecobacter sp.]
MNTVLRKVVTTLYKRPLLNKTASILADGPLYQPLILFFHGVQEKIIDPRIQMLHSTLENFEPLVHHLKRHFHLIDANELHARLQTRKPDLSRCVMLTFDDGYRDNATMVAPLLSSMGIPFTIYLTTSAIGTGILLPTFVARAALTLTDRKSCKLPGVDQELALDSEPQRLRAIARITSALKECTTSAGITLTHELMKLLSADQWADIRERFTSDQFMTWEQVREVNCTGAVIGAHGHEHFPLNQSQGRDEIRRQLTTSRDLITKHTGSCHHYAFPNGQPEDICPEALAAVEAAGFSTAVTTLSGPLAASTSPFLLPRSCVYTVTGLHRRILSSRFDGSARILKAWQTDLLHQAKGLA